MDRSSPLYYAAAFTAVAVFTTTTASSLLRQYFVRRMTVMNDIPNLGIARPDDERIKGRAIICGGSISGLWAARICSDHFEEVIIVEPEEWTMSEDAGRGRYDEKGELKANSSNYMRTRVFQYNCVHAYQPMALRALRRLFPDFDEEAKGTDGRIIAGSFNFHTHGGALFCPNVDEYGPNFRDIENFFMSRDAYERILRGLVRRYSKRIRWVKATAIDVKIMPGDASRLESVTIRTSDGTEEIPCSLVVDCASPAGIGVKWLRRIFTSEQLRPRPGSVPFDDLKLEYKTSQPTVRHRVFVPEQILQRLPIPGGYDNAGFIYAFVPKPGIEQCVFMLTRVEGHRIEFFFSGWGTPPLPGTVHDLCDYFVNFEGEEPMPGWLLDMVHMLLESGGEVTTDRMPIPPLSWTRYEKAPYLPSNFVAIGDAVMRVNPVFGQGCSKAAVGAITLDMLLRTKLRRAKDISSDFSEEFFGAHAVRISSMWMGTKAMDYQWDSTVPVRGEKRSDANFAAAFSSALMKLSTKVEE